MWFDRKHGRPTGRALFQMQKLNSWVTDEVTSRVHIMSPNSEREYLLF